jgi:hypothetical protein
LTAATHTSPKITEAAATIREQAAEVGDAEPHTAESQPPRTARSATR